MTTYQLGETVRLTATVTDSDGAASDPTTTKISIRKPDKSMAATAQDMTKSVTGSYYYDYLIAAEDTGQEGTYNVRVTATGAASRVTIQTSTFDAEVSI